MLFRAAKHSGRPLDRAKYKLKGNEVTAILRKSKQSFDKLNSADAKMFWKTVRLLNNQQSSIPVLQFSGTTTESSTDNSGTLRPGARYVCISGVNVNYCNVYGGMANG